MTPIYATFVADVHPYISSKEWKRLAPSVTAERSRRTYRKSYRLAKCAFDEVTLEVLEEDPDGTAYWRVVDVAEAPLKVISKILKRALDTTRAQGVRLPSADKDTVNLGTLDLDGLTWAEPLRRR